MQTDTEDESGGYNYPYPASSDDSFANLSENGVYEKLKQRLFINIAQKTDVSSICDEQSLQLEQPPKALNVSISIDPEWIDRETGEYLSYIIKSDDDSDETIDSEYDGDAESDFCAREERKSMVTPIQSTTQMLFSEFCQCQISQNEHE